MTSEAKAYMTVKEVAELFNVASNTVRRWVKKGKLSSFYLNKPTANSMRIPVASVKRFGERRNT